MSQLDERDLSCPQRLVWAVTINLLLRLLPTQNLFHMLIVQKTPSPPSPSSMGRIISPGEGRRRLSYERMHNGKSLTERQLPLYRSMPRTQLPTKLASLMHRGFESQGRNVRYPQGRRYILQKAKIHAVNFLSEILAHIRVYLIRSQNAIKGVRLHSVVSITTSSLSVSSFKQYVSYMRLTIHVSIVFD